MQDYSFFIPPIDTMARMDLNLYYCGTQVCRSGHHWGPGTKEYYKIHYIKSGKGSFSTAGKSYPLAGGQLFLIVPGTVSFYSADILDPWTYYWVAFSGTNALRYLKRAGFSKSHPVIHINNGSGILACFSDMFQASCDSKSGDLLLLSCLYRFFALLARENDVMPGESRAPAELYCDRAIEFIKMNYSKRIRIQTIADFLGLNRRYFSGLFRENIGVSPASYLRTFRLGKACELMRSSTLSVEEIAYSVGYEDRLRFSKTFRKYQGMSPREFRQECKISGRSTSASPLE